MAQNPLESLSADKAILLPDTTSEPINANVVSPGSTLFPLDDLKIDFDLESMKKQIRGHEGVVLYPYSDPQRRVALIGMGFNLNKEAVQHVKGDPADRFQYNNRVRIEPSTRELWNAAGAQANLDDVLKAVAFDANGYVKITLHEHYILKPELLALPPDRQTRLNELLETLELGNIPFLQTDGKANYSCNISAEDADKLFETSVRQAMYNAAAYFRHFKDMTPKQKIGATELVYQLGTNLEKFKESLCYANQDKPDWKKMCSNMHKSEWYRKYSHRAQDILNELDPDYVAPSHTGTHAKKGHPAEHHGGVKHHKPHGHSH